MFLLHITERVKIVKSPFLAFFHCEVTENGCVMNVTVWQISWRQHGGPPWETEAGGSQVWIQLGQLSNLVRPCLRIKRCSWRCSSVQRPCIQPLLPEEKKRKIFKKIWKAQGLWGPRRLNSVSSGSTVSRKYPYPPVCVPAGTGVTRPRCLSRCWWESWCRWPTLTPTWACHPWPPGGPMPARSVEGGREEEGKRPRMSRCGHTQRSALPGPSRICPGAALPACGHCSGCSSCGAEEPRGQAIRACSGHLSAAAVVHWASQVRGPRPLRVSCEDWFWTQIWVLLRAWVLIWQFLFSKF